MIKSSEGRVLLSRYKSEHGIVGSCVASLLHTASTATPVHGLW